MLSSVSIYRQFVGNGGRAKICWWAGGVDWWAKYADKWAAWITIWVTKISLPFGAMTEWVARFVVLVGAICKSLLVVFDWAGGVAVAIVLFKAADDSEFVQMGAGGMLLVGAAL